MICTEEMLAKDKMEEECGVFGVYCKENKEVSQMCYYAMYALQHRGQESAGITVSNGGQLYSYKGMGLTADVFTEETLNQLQGNAAIAHVRYSSFKDNKIENAQPIESRFKLGQIAVAHNGNLTNSKVIRELLEDGGATFTSTSDSEVVIKMIARKAADGLEEAIKATVSAVKGAYAFVMLADKKLIGIRDPYGIRPLCIGTNDAGDYFLASESCAIDAIGGHIVRDVEAGEMVIIDDNGIKSVKYAENRNIAPCSFEHIYFARPDSTIDGINVYQARVEAGKLLAKQCKVDADIVIGVPDSGVPAAIGYAEESGIPYAMGLIKNKYIARTFIKPVQSLREQAVMVKLNPLRIQLEGKRVVVVDDSLVRGTTSKILIEIIRRAGAKEVHFRSASPAVMHPCFYGVDIAHRKELIAARMSVEEIRQEINADTLDYLSLENMLTSLKSNNFCVGCFNGVYPMSTPTED
ncbi:amidophosphoribosyltransferase [Fusobacterium sp.]|uniref:amidophosphoribosyltransferase n=1 Tax=Fusobacterium sp. TaxID=68766 RepID=UPI001DC6F7A0|nr:amidophosphoribosyltransferase [Fusobacterium sp.]MBS5790896.1 amidophosphoribosyltransferase [Fusobacterium sp.]MDY3059202.1 amidophosphoribosyltransferase [Fusobacterium sp.]MEE1476622.1 amidophosphoribosyltransferase [Fusobacterium sp.]